MFISIRYKWKSIPIFARFVQGDRQHTRLKPRVLFIHGGVCTQMQQCVVYFVYKWIKYINALNPQEGVTLCDILCVSYKSHCWKGYKPWRSVCYLLNEFIDKPRRKVYKKIVRVVRKKWGYWERFGWIYLFVLFFYLLNKIWTIILYTLLYRYYYVCVNRVN